MKGLKRAWEGKRQGFWLSWLELEVLYQALDWKPITLLRHNLETSYPDRNIKSVSQFYRMVQKLVDRGYLADNKSGRETLVKITTGGAEEIGRFERYYTEKIYQRIQIKEIFQVISLVRERAGCLHDQLVVSYTPRDWLLKRTLDFCEQKDESEGLGVSNQPTYFLYLEDSQAEGGLEEEIEYFKVTDGKINLRDDIADIFISGGMLGHKKMRGELLKTFTAEIRRVLKPEGKIYLIEQTLLNKKSPLRHISELFPAMDASHLPSFFSNYTPLNHKDMLQIVEEQGFIASTELIFEGVFTVLEGRSNG